MKNYFCLFIFLFSISFQTNAHFQHTNVEEILSGPNILWNVVEVVTHVREIYLHPSELAGGDGIYHVLELAGHTGNIMNSFDETAWPVTLALFIFNCYAVTVQYRSITRNLHDASKISQLFAVFGTIDFLGHLYNSISIPYAFFQNKALSITKARVTYPFLI